MNFEVERYPIDEAQAVTDASQKNQAFETKCFV